MLMGGGSKGEIDVLKLCTESTPKTVVSHLSNVIAGGQRAPLLDPNDVIINVSHYNSNLPDNLYLLSGDGNLEPMAPALSNAANAPALTATSQPWRWVHEVFRKLIEQINNDNDYIAIIDTNLSFSIYTEIAIASADKIIVPANADDSSRVAKNEMFMLLHGASPAHPVYGAWTFAEREQRLAAYTYLRLT